MIEFDFKKIIGAIRRILLSITGLERNKIFYVSNQKIPDYPYITMEVTQPHVTEQSGATKERELFHTVLNVNAYSTDPINAIKMADEINTKLFDPYYIDNLNNNGVGIADVSLNGSSSDNLFGSDTVYTQNLQITLRFNRVYTSNISEIHKTNLGSDS